MKNKEFEARMAKVATIIAPKDTPPWLTEFLFSWVSSVLLDRSVHSMQPTKVEMRKRLIEVSKAATTLQRALQDGPIREFLELEGRIKIENDGGLDRTLRLIAERAQSAAESDKISMAKVAARKGRGKALPTGAASPKTYCALIISELWKALHGQYPASRNVEAAKAADAYWVAAGGSEQRDGSEPFSSWRYHFQQARPPVMEKIRSEICRHINIYQSDQIFMAAENK
jgi:hypothetical protein